MNNLFLWIECICELNVPQMERMGTGPDGIFLRGTGYRMLWAVHWSISDHILCFQSGPPPGPFDVPAERHIKWLKAFNEVGDWMVDREILPDEKGVLYPSAECEVLWAFSNLTLWFDGEQPIRDVVTGETFNTAQMDAQARHVYVRAVK